MIGSVRDRATFEAFRRRGRRARRGPITVVYLPPSDGPAPEADLRRLAFGIGRHVGTAVVRNLLRRRLREIVRHMVHVEPALPAGAYLIIAQAEATRLSYRELEEAVGAACREVTS